MEQQADIVRLLLHYFQAPLVAAEHVRGVLPVAFPAEAVRVVIGAPGGHRADRLTAYEIPLREDDGLRGGYEIISLLRAVLSAPHDDDPHCARIVDLTDW
ncbi:hypothetical protein [Sphaerisporangium krabiense]|uniref:Uncharacterized protein n=1 Tax=Sphaerisporangium krabiense TaxID=763782 RepID=A0A7W9DQ62_9ACTN|nr:hypothetical protein [Sphaerisporangium krabiense]MBB5626694.1 hypothetical protein [Sphaerisporangium krabiense]